jgi:hypothetical protein
MMSQTSALQELMHFFKIAEQRRAGQRATPSAWDTGPARSTRPTRTGPLPAQVKRQESKVAADEAKFDRF